MLQKELRQAKSIDNVYNSAYWHLAQQDYTIAEIRTKLERKTENQDWIETVLADLIGKGYIKSDFDFAVRFAESAFNNEHGKSAITRKLRARGVGQKEVAEAIEQVMYDEDIDQFALAASRLSNSFQTFHSTTKEKVYSQFTTKGFSRAEIDHALAMHPAKDTLRSKLEVKAEKADLSKETMKLYRKGKGKRVILNELRRKLIDVEDFDNLIDQLEEAGDIDFYQSCLDVLHKKRLDISSSVGKSKAYAYLSGKGFDSDQIKEALNPTD
ncbi:MAG: RecX family transcriptional regulator [Moritella sp.]|uniref:RecX family transcriptional regulator n=1 Tax=Moritella sp. TaxID=78556 RepID=UPI0029B65BFB|nr:RecX family transcriptional regulator [Moritella sp.]MDX2321239.1 RecX family transcriptional regulator [Moritella sp.]